MGRLWRTAERAGRIMLVSSHEHRDPAPDSSISSLAIAEGDIRVLLMVLVHLTGDERWLEPPYNRNAMFA